uniref:mammalian ependymin-related protein 1-like n=1 Tax=Ciona intestinalis TaxID=7719 RepID=UPI0000521E8A|nr:mammalian ependymin-related protein 1-like [Ciona intestinalis]|eukprot:XP_002128930.1 mammalian ependymin-related protein 1-like [Ciona intestinalis]
MKLLVLFSFFACVALAAAQTPCVSPGVFEAKAYAFDHHERNFVIGKISYDENQERVRLVDAEYENSNLGQYDTLYAFKEKTQYRVDMKTKECTKSPLTGDYFPFGIFPKSTYTGSFILGSLSGPGTGVIVQEWYYKNADGGVWVQLYTEHGCLPIQAIFIGHDSAGEEIDYHYEYMDVTLGVQDPAVFDVPKECL